MHLENINTGQVVGFKLCTRTIRMSCPKLKPSAKSEIVSLANRILSGELGLIDGSRRINSASAGSDEWYKEPLIVFMSVSSQTDHLPVGDVRKEWAPEALAKKDKEIESAEAFFRDEVREACRRIISEFSGQEDEKR